jgi:predicted ATP-grasp superfamily ATP-dependent carboligase
MKVFIIHARRTGYGVIRSLKHKHPSVYIADTERTPVFKSVYVKDSFLISDITKVSEEVFLHEMISLAHKMDYKKEKPVVYTGKDDYLIFFSRNYERLSEYFLLSFETNYSILHQALDKTFLPEIATRAQVKFPKTLLNPTFEEVTRGIPYPVVLKPYVKNTPELDVVQAAFRVAICNNDDMLTESLQKIQSFGVGYVAQEYIPGSDADLHTIATYSYSGELRAWSTSKKVRQFPPTMGECSYGITTYQPELSELAERLVRTLGLTGISQIEFKSFNGDYYLIEINPRVWSWHQIHTLVGVNLCEIAYHSLTHSHRFKELIEPVDREVRWAFLMMDFHFNVWLNKNITLKRFISSHFKADLEAFFCLEDPMVFADHFIKTLKHFYFK